MSHCADCAIAQSAMLGRHLSRIGGATFSAGAGGNAGWAPAFCASASGRAGCGGISVGRWPVVVGSEGADGLVSAPGVDCVGGVACATRMGSLALRTVIAAVEMAKPATISMDARSISRRYSLWRFSADMTFNPTKLCTVQRNPQRLVPPRALPGTAISPRSVRN